jgi:hypothetical protein
MREILLSQSEIDVIKIWADNTIHGGHWGDGDFMIPEENIILDKFDKVKNGKVHLTKNEVRIILTWSESSHGIHTIEEENVINKLKSTIEKMSGKYK